jgi:protein SCO1/2
MTGKADPDTLRRVRQRGAKGWGFFVALSLVAGLCPLPVLSHQPGKDARLSKIGPAPEFTLTTQDGRRLSLKDLRGKVVTVTFIYASCTDTYPLLTAKMAGLQEKLGDEFGATVYFASVTVDPERDTPEALRRYAEAHGAKPAGWAFLTGTPTEVREVARRYGVYYKKASAAMWTTRS